MPNRSTSLRCLHASLVSILFNFMKSFNFPRYFTSSLIDHNGGEVVLVGTGIKLVIPEGAINFGKSEVVFLALIGNPELIPKCLNDDESLLAPVLMCGPHGLRFKKYVLLILPHCVTVFDEMQKTFRGLSFNSIYVLCIVYISFT